ncbi:putative caffeoyl-CoA O-methyltransferase 2 [Tolypocladium ophioglossoides CBS 100239]|uniref:Putative caffeoyl-CoA O-methyltransferase 2 n=1 Tax=Tolypocladium ophioglossoides (strain CBS 100239) TaxID=1163406 RepID=A0A0L0N6Q7_TOLOC|nr:putative caffeoyl-CoA O-methyltransferase 2 [Tolypocladium ophioglossoides CBS 100239]
MKSGSTNLYTNPEMGERVTAYSTAHSSPLPKHITDYHAAASTRRDDSMMLSSNFQSQLHLLLANAIGAKRVLEIGVYVGYSAMLWAHATGPDGTVTGLEFSPELAQIARDAFAAQGLDNIEIIVGDGAETLPKLSATTPYDLVFLDADKTGYSNYLRILLARSQPGAAGRLLRPGALIVADNVLRRGQVADPAVTKPEFGSQADWDAHILALRKFNDECVAEARLETFMVPLWDGLSIMRLRD